MKLAIIDLDNVVVDNTERETRARQFADTRFVFEAGIIPNIVYRDAWMKIFHSERALYKPEWVALDTLIAGVHEAIASLENEGYEIIFLSSRPEYLREATSHWLLRNRLAYSRDAHGMLLAHALVLKAPAFMQPPPKHTYTAVWKAGMVQTLAAFHGADEIVFVDDSEENCEALRQATSTEGLLHLWCYHSLQEAIAGIQEG